MTTKLDVRAYLAQGETWYSPREGLVPISGMTPDHKSLALRWLNDKAVGLIGVCESSANEDILTEQSGTSLGDVLRLMEMNPREWIRSTPLYRALAAR
jgi:hypothetical protein